MARRRSHQIAADGELVVLRDGERPGGRLLRQGDMDASYVDLADERHLEFDYLRWIRAVLRVRRARQVVHIGAGACSLARALLAEDRGSRQRVYEIDGRVLEIARAHLGLRRMPGLSVRVGDGRDALARHADASAEAIVIDAFTGARVPRRLVTVEALSQCARVAPLTIVNVVDSAGWPHARAVAAGLALAYPGTGALAASRRAGNVVAFGFAGVFDAAALEARVAADPSPPRLFRACDLLGASPWRD